MTFDQKHYGTSCLNTLHGLQHNQNDLDLYCLFVLTLGCEQGGLHRSPTPWDSEVVSSDVFHTFYQRSAEISS